MQKRTLKLPWLFFGVWVASKIFWAFILAHRLPFHIDSRLYAYPDHAVNLEIFRNGLLPLWNPYLACGVPQLADWQSACLYPPFWLFQWTGLPGAFMEMALAHSLFAFAGCFLWLRSQKAGSLFSLLGAIAFSESAHLNYCLGNLPFIATASWIPWIFWLAHRAMGRSRFLDWLFLAAALSLQILAGYPFFTFYTWIFLVVWFFAQKSGWAKILRFGGTLLAALLLTCAQWLPFLDFLTNSNQDFWVQYPYFTRPLEYLTLFNPLALGFPGTAGYRGNYANAVFNLYFGLLPLLAFAAQTLWFKKLSSKFWLLSALVVLLFLAGPQISPTAFLPLSWLEFIEPSKAVGLFVFAAVTSVSIFLNWISNRWKAPSIALLAVGALWIFDLLLVPFRLLHPLPNPYEDPFIQKQAAEIKSLAQGQRIWSLQKPGRLDFRGEEGFARSFLDPILLFLCNSNAAWRIRSAADYLVLRVDGSENLMRYGMKGFPFEGDLPDVAGIRLFLMPQALPHKYRAVAKLEDQFVNLNPEASEDLRWVPKAVELPSRPDILNLLAGTSSQWRGKVYLEKDSQGNLTWLPSVSRTLAFPPITGSTHALASRASNFTDHPAPGYVAFNESYCPGWHAWVDGNPLPILRAYGLFMAVPVPQGRHQVDFRYEPTSFRLGLFMTLLATFLLIAGILRSYFVPIK